jgi:hypothetical protein
MPLRRWTRRHSSQRDEFWSFAIFAHAQKSRSDGTMVARGFSPWTQFEFRVRRGATPESIACNSS